MHTVSDMIGRQNENPAAEFQTFYSSGTQYLMHVQDKAARIFGLRYLEYLQAQHRGTKTTPPKPATPDQRLVQAELDQIYTRYYRLAG